MEIYIVRHGETSTNKEGIFQGWLDDPLNDYGIQLAELTGNALKGTVFDIAYSSPLARAKETCNIILDKSGNSCPIIYDDRLKEINMGIFEGKKYKTEIQKIDPSFHKLFFKNPCEYGRIPNGESINDVMKRTQQFLLDTAKLNYNRILVSSHGCAIRAMLNFLYENPDDFWQNKVPENCSINIVDVKDGILTHKGSDIILYDKSLIKDRFPVK